ncbi:MAG: glutamate-1-semialdehyde 2,1-aminomutase [Acidobacteriota bacterium]
MVLEKSESLYKRACSVIPGGVNSPVRAFRAVGGHPIYFASGSGSGFVDVDGNPYVDFCMSWGPLILGHAHPAVIKAVIDAAGEGLSFGACHEREVLMAEAILRAFPEYEMVRVVSSGTEAVMSAIRLARGGTGRPYILKFDGCYHGHSDGLLVRAGSGLATQSIATSAGVPDEIASTTLVAPLDDEETLDTIFRTHGDRIAAAIIEPLPANAGLLEQRPELLARLRELTLSHGTLLIFDEVISGLRFKFGGYGQMVGICPDIVTLGKIIGGGMPVGAVVSYASLMDHFAPTGKVYQAGTLSGNPLSLAAGLATIGLLERGSVYSRLDALGLELEVNLAAAKIPGFRRIGSVFWLYLDSEPPPRHPRGVSERAVERFNLIHRRLLLRGYYMPPSAWEVGFLSTAHTSEQIRGFASALAECLSA